MRSTEDVAALLQTHVLASIPRVQASRPFRRKFVKLPRFGRAVPAPAN